MSLYKPLMSHAGLMIAHYTAAALGEIHKLQPISCAFIHMCVCVHVPILILCFIQGSFPFYSSV